MHGDDSVFRNAPSGCNVLYMDGHVEFVKFPGRFPVSKAWGQFVSTLSDKKSD